MNFVNIFDENLIKYGNFCEKEAYISNLSMFEYAGNKNITFIKVNWITDKIFKIKVEIVMLIYKTVTI